MSSNFPLLELPDELLAIVCQYVALQRYSISESRRPKPSPLFTLAHSHSRLHAFATALLHRRMLLNHNLDPTMSSPRHARFVQAQMESWPPYSRHALGRLEPMAACETVELMWTTARQAPSSPSIESDQPTVADVLRLCPNMTTLHLRRPRVSPPTALLTAQRHLRTLSAHLPEPGWLPVLSLLPHITHASFSLKENTPPMGAWAVPAFWGHVQELELETAPHRQGASVHPVRDLFAALKVPATSTLKRLKVGVRLQLQTTPVRGDLALLVDCLRPFSHLALEELAMDDYVQATPETIVVLAKLFPTIQKLSFGSRIVWYGTPDAHFDALAGFGQLRELECPRWPEANEPWREAEDLIGDLAVRLPRLELVGLGGQQSSDQCYRVERGRDEQGRSSRVEPVTLFCTDLDQGR